MPDEKARATVSGSRRPARRMCAENARLTSRTALAHHFLPVRKVLVVLGLRFGRKVRRTRLAHDLLEDAGPDGLGSAVS